MNDFFFVPQKEVGRMFGEQCASLVLLYSFLFGFFFSSRLIFYCETREGFFLIFFFPRF